MNEQVIQMCQTMLQHVVGNKTRKLIAETVDEVLAMRIYQSVAGNANREVIIKKLEEMFPVWTDKAQVLSSDDKHESWLPGKRGVINWGFWDRYKLYLLGKLPLAAIDSIHEVTDKVLERLEDPVRNGPWDRRGLVMGNVQSGKTANYTGLVCKAADAGYKVIIVLAGLHNNLRSQTQIRLDEGFLGYRASAVLGENGAFETTGVGLLSRSVKADSVTNRHNNGDFNQAAAKQFAINPGGHPLLFVVKKNVSVLRNLLRWIRSSADMTDPDSGRKFHKDTPILVIDDESDQASVDTRAVSRDEEGHLDPDHDPTTTNSLIRQLLYSFGKSAYVGYTATPFANIYIHEHSETEKEGADLFPRSFIINIPPPSNYTGAARIFGIRADDDAGLEDVESLPITRVIDDYAVKRNELGDISTEGVIGVREDEGWMPPRPPLRTGHIPIYNGKEQVPPSLRKAIMTFIISTAVRELREGKGCHNSMLVHVVRYTAVQERVAAQVKDALNHILNRLKNGDGDRSPTVTEEFQELWQTDYMPTSKASVFSSEGFGDDLVLPVWEEVADKLWSVATSIDVRTINGTAADVLDYDDQVERGLNVIAVGADKLSRGLTLEGLTVSYFLRASRMYDTLMQMGRWFGYRNHYADVCRLYTTDDLIEWFTHIASASEELRLDFDYMVNSGGTPRDYGLKVRSHSVLLVTSAVKMRHGQEMQLSYSADLSQTIFFDRDSRKKQKNINVISEWLVTLENSDSEYGNPDKGYMWSGVTPEKVCEILQSIEVNGKCSRAQPRLLAKYIEKKRQKGELKEWTVYLSSTTKKASKVQGKPQKFDLQGVGVIGIQHRAEFQVTSTKEEYGIKALVDPVDESRDLVGEEPDLAREITVRNWSNDTSKRKAKNEPSRPTGRAIRSVRPSSRGLIIFYPIHDRNNLEADGLPYFGMAVSFPESEYVDETVSYTVNNVYSNAGDYDNI